MRIPLRRSSLGQLAIAAPALLLSILSIVAFASRYSDRREVGHLLDRYARTEKDGDSTSQPAADAKKQPRTRKTNPAGKHDRKSPQQEQVARIQKRNIFSPPAKKSFAAKLIGVLGDEAIFQGNKLVKVGGTISGAKVTKIGPDWVEVVYQGKPRKLMVFAAGGPSGAPGGPPRPPAGGPPGPPGGAPPAVRRMPPGRPGGPAFQITPEMIEQFKQMPPEMREKALRHMPPEIRKHFEQAQ